MGGIELQRKKWQVETEIWRNKITYQKKEAINKGRREKYRQQNDNKNEESNKRAEKETSQQGQELSTADATQADQCTLNSTSSVSETSTANASSSTRVAISRFKKKFFTTLPSEPSKRAEVIAAGINALTPVSKKAVTAQSQFQEET